MEYIIRDDLLISSNKLDSLTKKIDTIEETVKKNEQDIQEITKSLEFTQEQLIDVKVKELSTEIENCTKNYKNAIETFEQNHKETLDELNEKLRVMEDRSRRTNLRIDGVKEMEKESWSDCEKKVKDILKNKLNLENVEIERAHRMGKRKQDQTHPRSIIFKLASWKTKEEILSKRKSLKDTGFYINEDFSEATNKIRKELFVKRNEQRKLGKFSVVVYDRLITRDFPPN